MKKNIFLGLLISNIQVAMDSPRKTEKLVQRADESKDRIDGIGAYEQFKQEKPLYTVSLDQVRAIFPRLFEYIPSNLHQAIANYLPYAFPKEDSLINELSKLLYSEFALRAFKWKALGYAFGLMPYYSFDQGYFYFEQPVPKEETAILKGIREDHTVKLLADFDEIIRKLSFSRDIKKEEFIKQAKSEREDVANSLSQEYKIHLMPQGDLTPTIVTLLTLLKNDPELQNLIAAFKVMVVDKVEVKGIFYPRIVIYPTRGKENAQKALNKLFAGLKEIKGLDIKPLFNAKVTDLIWIAQGDSYYKKYPAYKSYFEDPKLVYFHKDLTGKEHNYHLAHPETGKEIV